MTHKDMKPGIIYRVTKESTDGTFSVGSLIVLANDGSISEITAGWVDREDWDRPETNDFEAEVWQDRSLLEKIKDNITYKPDINELALIYQQSALLHARSGYIEEAVTQWHVSEYLKEFVVLKNLVYNTMKRL